MSVETSEQTILAGSPAPTDVAVVGIATRVVTCAPQPSVITCTGTLVAPRLVVTAAHCLGFDPPNAFDVFFGDELGVDGTTIPAIAGRIHPDYDPVTHANDIAVLVLASPSPITPIPMRAAALPDLTGTTVRMVGFGISAIDAMDTGTRRTGTARVTGVGTDDISMEPAPAMSCHGDSGGPVLADLGAGEELIGVTTHGDAACATLGVALRVDRQLATFLQPILDETLPVQRAFDPAESACATTCASDADCPLETTCFGLDDQPRHCVYRGLPAGTFTTPCTAGDTSDLCIAMPDHTCRQYQPCDSAPPDDGCDCGAGDPTGGFLVLAMLALSARRRGRRPARRTASMSRAA